MREGGLHPIAQEHTPVILPTIILLPGWTRHRFRDLRLDPMSLLRRHPVAQGVELQGDLLPEFTLCADVGFADAGEASNVTLARLTLYADGLDKDRAPANAVAPPSLRLCRVG